MGSARAPDVPGPRGLLYRVAPLVTALALAACALPGGRSGPLGGGASPYDRGVVLLARGAFPAADSALRASASPCRMDGEAHGSLLLLASLHQDPRNPVAHPDSAALMAARYLSLGGGTTEGRRLAEGLYAQALDRGGDPGLRPDGSWPQPGDCGSPGPAGTPLALPVLSATPYAAHLRAARNRLDSLEARHGAVLGRLQELEAELARIRRLLQEPDTAGPGAPPGA